MADKNIVEYGFQNVYFAEYTYDKDAGTVTIGTPLHVAGAVTFSPSTESSSEPFYADDGPYFNGVSFGMDSGDLEMARFPDDWKVKFGGYVKTKDGGLATVKSPKCPAFCLIAQSDGDAQATRHIWYNCTASPITREYKTTEDKIEVSTEKITVTCVGDVKSGIKHTAFHPGDTGYDTLFTAPAAPEVYTETETSGV